MRAYVVLLAFLFLVPFLSTSGYATTQNITGCTTLGTSGDTYALTTSIANSGSSNCIVINANHTTLDCQGYTIDGILSDGQVAINLANSRTNITIKNCIITEWAYGISTQGLNNSLIENNTINASKTNGINIDSVGYSLGNNTIRFNSITYSRNYGITISPSNNTIHGNNLSHTNNTVGAGYQGTAFIINGASGNNTFYNNTANYNRNTGIDANNNNNNIYNNTVSFNDVYGIDIAGSNNNVYNNTVNNNGYYGIYINNPTSSNISWNAVQENSRYDFYFFTDGNPSICANAMNNNTISRGEALSFYNSSVSLQSGTISELILCNANNSVIANVNISGSDSKTNNVLLLLNSYFINVTNMTSSFNFKGIEMIYSSNVTVANSTFSNNNDAGYYLQSGTSNTTIANSTLNNSNYGVFVNGGGWLYNIIEYNEMHNNNLAGIEIQSNYNMTIRNNTLRNNNNGINLRNSYNVTVLYNKILLSNASGLNYTNPTDNGENITVRLNEFSNNSIGIHWYGDLTYIGWNNISENTISFSNIGMKLISERNNSIIANSFNYNNLAMKLTSSYNNTIMNNTFYNNIVGINLDPSSNNIISSNTFDYSGNDILDDSSNTYSGNIIRRGDSSGFAAPSNMSYNGTINSLFGFNMSIKLPNGTSSTYQIRSIAIYPNTTVAYTNNSGVLTGNFTPAQGGIYSLLLNLTVNSNNITLNYPVSIGGDIEESITYRIRSSTPRGNQPRGFNVIESISGTALLLNAPSTNEASVNTGTHIFSVDETPLTINNVFINQLNSSILYRSTGSNSAVVGFQPLVLFDNSTIVNTTFPNSSALVLNATSFVVNWTIADPSDWTKIGGKLIGNNVSWHTNNTHQSNVTFRYRYASGSPQVFNLTGGTLLLAATSNSSTYASVTLDGNGTATFIVQLPSTFTYTVLYDGLSCSLPTCNSTQSGNNATVSVSLGSVHTVEFYIPTTATTTTTSSGGGGSLVDVKGNVLQPGGIPTVDEQASTTSVPPSSVPARPGTYTISEEGAVILLEGNLTTDNETTPGTIYIVGYPQSPFIVGGIVKSDPLKYGSLPARAGFATKAFASYDIKIESGIAYLCMNYRGFENPSSVTVFEYTGGAWRELPRERFANNLTTSTACGTVKGTPYMVAGFIAATVPTIISPIQLPAFATNLPLAVYALGALAAVVYFAYRFRSRKK